jgi:hypothetical protein
MHPFLAGEVDMPVARRFERLSRKLVIEAFDLLQAQDIRLLTLEESDDAVDA